MAWCGRFSLDGIDKSAAFCEKKRNLCSQREKCKNDACKCKKLKLSVEDKSRWEGHEDPREAASVVRMLHNNIAC